MLQKPALLSFSDDRDVEIHLLREALRAIPGQWLPVCLASVYFGEWTESNRRVFLNVVHLCQSPMFFMLLN
jgi:hypothetical protein